eukprot:11948172-Heterocapsa_arctica.AAC.1
MNWSDMRIISELYLLQLKYGIVHALPAIAYALAIRFNDPALHYQPIPGEELAPEVAEKRLQREADTKFVNENFGIPPA